MFELEGNREMLNKERTVILLSPLKNEPLKWEKIKFGGKSFDIESATYAAEILTGLKNLKSVDLSDIISGKSKEEANAVLKMICESLNGNNNIVQVDISDNALGEMGIISCESLLRKNMLEELTLNNDGLSHLAGQKLKQILIVNNQNIGLKKLHIFNNMLDDGGAREFAEILNYAPNLINFRYSSTRSKIDGIVSLCNSLLTTNKLVELDLSDNTAGSGEGSIRLANLLSNQKNLKKLNLTSMGLKDQGFQKISESLAFLSLTHLDLTSNEITTKSVTHLINALKNSINTLEVLVLDENEFGKNVINFAPFIEFIKENNFKNLSSFSFKQNQLKKSSIISLLGSLDSFSLLTSLDLNENLLSKSDLEEIDQIMGEKNILQSMDDCFTDDEGDDGSEGSDDESDD